MCTNQVISGQQGRLHQRPVIPVEVGSQTGGRRPALGAGGELIHSPGRGRGDPILPDEVVPVQGAGLLWLL